jgi:hypothetical protein
VRLNAWARSPTPTLGEVIAAVVRESRRAARSNSAGPGLRRGWEHHLRAHTWAESSLREPELAAHGSSRERVRCASDRIDADQGRAGRARASRREVSDDLLELRLDVDAADVVVGGGRDGARIVGARDGADVRVEPREKL